LPAITPSSPIDLPSFQFAVFLRALWVPFIFWVGLVAAATIGGQPGVVCITPMGWLLSLYCGGQYIRLSRGPRGKWPLLGPALAGATLGFGMGILFVVVNSFGLPVGNTLGELGKAIFLDVSLGLGGVLICSALSVFTGWLMLSHERPVA
jgi:hypothetical protein